MTKKNFYLFLIVFLSSGFLYAQNLPKLTTLKNGLRILTVENSAAPVVIFSIWYKVGSKNEQIGKTGISHFLEHILFKSTKNYSDGEITRTLQKQGAVWNGMTDKDWTVYFETIASDRVETAIKVEAERMINAKLKPEEIKTEKGVVKNEIQIGENQSQFQLYNAVTASAYTTHPYRWSVAGSGEDVGSVEPTQLKNYYSTYYVPNNATVVCVGDFKTEELVNLIEKHFGKIKPGKNIPKYIPGESPQKGERRTTVKGEGSSSHIAIAYHITSSSHGDIYALDVLNRVLSSGRTSRLHKRLVDGNLSPIFYTNCEKREHPGLFWLFATARAGIDLKKIEEAIFEEIEKIKQEGVKVEELNKVLAQATAEYVYNNDNIENLALALGRAEIAAGYEYYIDYLANLKKVTTDEVKRVCEKYLLEDNRTVGNFIPIKPKEEKLESPFKEGSFYKKPPEIKREVLPNGMRVVILEDKSNPSVYISGKIKAGVVHEPQKLVGISLLTAELLDKGTKTKTSSEIALSLEEIGAELSFGFSREMMEMLSVDFLESTTFSGKCLSKDTEKVLEILSDILQNPSFPDDELQKLRILIHTGLQVIQDSPEARAILSIFETMYPEEHPFRNFSLSSISRSIKRIKREDVVNFYNDHYGGENAILVIVGDVQSDEILNKIKELFSTYHSKKGETKIDLPEVIIPEKTKKKVLSMMDKSQCAVVCGYPLNLTRKSPDYYAAQVMNGILGASGFSSRITKKIRVEKGYSYVARSILLPQTVSLPYLFGFTASPANVDDGLKVLIDEIKKMKEKGVSKEEFEDEVSYITGSYSRRLATKSQIANALLTAEYYELGIDYPWKHLQYYKKLKIDEVNNAAKKYLHPDNLITIIAGPYKEKEE